MRKVVGFKGDSKFIQMIRFKRKKRLMAFSVLSTSLVLGNLSFLTSLLSGFLIAKFLGSKETGRPSRLPSIRFPLARYKVHLHHWLISSAVIALALSTGPWFFPSHPFYGFLSGVAFQGIYCYDDWYKILLHR